MRSVRTRPAPAGPAGTYVYGLMAAGSALPEPLDGVGGLPVEVVPLDGFAAVVSPGVDRETFGVPDDLLAHTRVLDRLAERATVIPLAFGTFTPDDLQDQDDIAALAEAYEAAIEAVDGAVQFTLTVRYEQDVALTELVREDPAIARLREQTAGPRGEARQSEKLRLGELVVQGLERKAAADAARILDVLARIARGLVERERRQADEVVEVAALVDRDAEEVFEQRCDELAEAFAGRARFRLVGPQAPYDFVGRG